MSKVVSHDGSWPALRQGRLAGSQVPVILSLPSVHGRSRTKHGLQGAQLQQLQRHLHPVPCQPPPASSLRMGCPLLCLHASIHLSQCGPAPGLSLIHVISITFHDMARLKCARQHTEPVRSPPDKRYTAEHEVGAAAARIIPSSNDGRLYASATSETQHGICRQQLVHVTLCNGQQGVKDKPADLEAGSRHFSQVAEQAGASAASPAHTGAGTQLGDNRTTADGCQQSGPSLLPHLGPQLPQRRAPAQARALKMILCLLHLVSSISSGVKL